MHQTSSVRMGGLIVLALALLAGCSSYQALSSADDVVPPAVETIHDGAVTLFRPAGVTESSPAEHGIIFYPGGLVSPDAYASLLAPIAAEGIPVAIVAMPFDLAVFGEKRAQIVLDGSFGEYARHWSLAGHSLGGAMVARFAAREADAYPKVDSLVQSGLRVLSIWAENDGLATALDREATSALMPETTTYLIIEGGNHAGFGDYGPQKGDGEASISPESQHRQVRDAIVRFLGAHWARDEGSPGAFSHLPSTPQAGMLSRSLPLEVT